MAKCYYCGESKKGTFRGMCCSDCYEHAEPLQEGLLVYFTRNIRRPDGKFDLIVDHGVINKVIKNYLPKTTGIFRYRVSNGKSIYTVHADNISIEVQDMVDRCNRINSRRSLNR